MKRSSMILCVAAAFAALSCKPAEIKPVYDHNFSVTASLQSFEGGYGTVSAGTWTKGDKISVVNLTTGKVLASSLVTETGGTESLFTGTVHGSISKTDVLALYYPAVEAEQESEFGSRTIDISAQKPGTLLMSYGTFSVPEANGEYSGMTVKCRQALSCIKFNVKGISAGTVLDKLVLRKVSDSFTVSISGGDFSFAGDACDGRITVSGPFYPDAGGAFAITALSFPRQDGEAGSVIVSSGSSGSYLAAMNPVSTVAGGYQIASLGKFERVSVGSDEYGAYLFSGRSGKQICAFTSGSDSIISGQENGENDFTVLTPSKGLFWTMKGIPSDATEGSTFTARVSSHGYEDLPDVGSLEAKVVMAEEEDGYTKMWVKSGDYLFIVRK